MNTISLFNKTLSVEVGRALPDYRIPVSIIGDGGKAWSRAFYYDPDTGILDRDADKLLQIGRYLLDGRDGESWVFRILHGAVSTMEYLCDFMVRCIHQAFSSFGFFGALVAALSLPPLYLVVKGGAWILRALINVFYTGKARKAEDALVAEINRLVDFTIATVQATPR